MISKFDPPLLKRRHKSIKLQSGVELNDAVQAAIVHCKEHDLDFYKILHGIDAYMERRRRRDSKQWDEDYKSALDGLDEDADPWGHS
jgi:hypothetical protein